MRCYKVNVSPNKWQIGLLFDLKEYRREYINDESLGSESGN